MSKRRPPWQRGYRSDLLKQVRRVVVSPAFIIAGSLLGVVLVLIVVVNLGGGGAAPTTTDDTTVRVSMGEVFFIQRHPATKRVEWLGSLIIWLLLALSATSVGLMIRYAMESGRAAILPDDLVKRAQALLRERRVSDMLEFTRGSNVFFARVLDEGLHEIDHGHGAMIRAAEQTSEQRTVHLLRRIEPLNIIGNVSPMIGLFGTVYGMILAFREIVASGGTPDPVNLASGIGTALVTTFWGLVVAIPALSGYAVLRNRIDELTSQAMGEAEELLNLFRPPAAGGDNQAAPPNKRAPKPA